MEWEKMSKNHISNRELIPQIYKELIEVQTIAKNIQQQKTNNPLKMSKRGDCFKEKYTWLTSTCNGVEITNQQGNTNQNHHEISPHICQDDCQQYTSDNKCWQGYG